MFECSIGLPIVPRFHLFPRLADGLRNRTSFGRKLWLDIGLTLSDLRMFAWKVIQTRFQVIVIVAFTNPFKHCCFPLEASGSPWPFCKPVIDGDTVLPGAPVLGPEQTHWLCRPLSKFMAVSVIPNTLHLKRYCVAAIIWGDKFQPVCSARQTQWLMSSTGDKCLRPKRTTAT